GTLDPFASGLLLLCVGPATRLAEYLTGLPKTYAATLRLGEVTDTDDLEGTIAGTNGGWIGTTRADVEAAFGRLEASEMRVPPRYSAKKVEGERMYALARAGREVTQTPVPVRIYRIQLTRFEPPAVDFEVDCSSGTYIRSIARDLGGDLGVGAHLTALRRLKIGEHSVQSAVTVEELGDDSRVAEVLLDPADAVSHLPRVVLSESEIVEMGHGRGIVATADLPDGPIALVSADGKLVAIGRGSGNQV